MRIFRSFAEASSIRNPVVTTGSFDGVHVGHKTIINRLKVLADKYGGESVLITFDPHPRKVLYPESAGKNLKLITSQAEKLELLREAGLDNIIVVGFTREFSRITSEEFVRDYLCGMLGAKVIVAGFNHHFGFNQEGDYRKLWDMRSKYDFDAEEIPEQEVQNETVSSTRIRQAVSEGYIQKANAYLDHYYIIIGKPRVTPDLQLPFSFSIIPMTEECKLLPAPGIYAISFGSGDFSAKAMAIINQGPAGQPEVLLHLFDSEMIPYGADSTLYFHKKIRGPVNLADPQSAVPRIRQAMNEIGELIY